MSEPLAQPKWLVSVGVVFRSCMTLLHEFNFQSIAVLLHLSSLILTEVTPAIPIPAFLTASGGNFLCFVKVLWAPQYSECSDHGMGLLPLHWYKSEVSSHHVHLMLPREVMSQHHKPRAWSILMSIFLFSSAHREITGAGKWNLCSVACFYHLCTSSFWHKGISFLLKLPHGYPLLVHALGVKFAPVEFHVTLLSVLLVCQLQNST